VSNRQIRLRIADCGLRIAKLPIALGAQKATKSQIIEWDETIARQLSSIRNPQSTIRNPHYFFPPCIWESIEALPPP
jgi:hypothetical protein